MASQKNPSVALDRGCPSVEIYRTPSGRDFGYRVIASAADASAEALRAAKALALAVEDDLYSDLKAVREARNAADVVSVWFPSGHKERLEALAAEQGVSGGEILRRLVSAHLSE